MEGGTCMWGASGYSRLERSELSKKRLSDIIFCPCVCDVTTDILWYN